MKKGIIFDKSKKIFPIIVMAIGIVLALALFIMRLNLVAVVNVAYMCIVVALTILGILFFKKLYLWNFIGYGVSGLAIVLYYAIWGADAGFGAFSSGKAGWSSAANALFAIFEKKAEKKPAAAKKAAPKKTAAKAEKKKAAAEAKSAKKSKK